jgi:transposase-like protein
VDEAHTEGPKGILGFSKPEVKEKPMKIKCPFCMSESCKVHQKNGGAYSTMFRCMDCGRFYSERRFTGYSGLKLPPEKITQIVNCLVEGISIRATTRLVDVEKKTVKSLDLKWSSRVSKIRT